MRALVSTAFICIILTGCSGMAQQQSTLPSAQTGAGNALPQSSNSAVVFISNTNNNDIDYFSLGPGHKRLGAISGSPLGDPTGMAVDSSNNVYVANAAGFVLVYPQNLKAPSRTLQDPGYFANAVAVGGDGTVYVANLFDAKGSKQSPGNVVAYAPGSTNPSKTFDDSNFFYVTGVAVDAKNDLFVSYDEGSDKDPTQTGRVAEFVGGSSKPKEIIAVPGPKGNSGVTALALDANNDIVVAAFGPATFDVYPPGSKKPSRTFSGGSNRIAEGIAFDSSGAVLYSTELASKLADIFDYATGKRTGTIADTSTSQYGIAVRPPLEP